MKDTNEELYCPLCGAKMQKFLLNGLGINIDICLDGCGSLFFDNQELKKTSSNEVDRDALLKLFEDREFKKSEKQGNLRCPTCGKLMVEHFTTPSQRNPINDCYFCGATFVEKDAFIKIIEEAMLPEEKKEKMLDYIGEYMTPQDKYSIEQEGDGTIAFNLFLKDTYKNKKN